MDAKVSVGRLSDVDVAIDWTWIAVAFASFAVLVAASPWVLSTLSPMELAIFAAVAAASLFASLALHELVRVAVLRASGVAVRGVTVFVLGGISDAETRPPRADAAAALVVQSASAVTGAAALGVAAVLVGGAAPSAAAVARSAPLVAAIAWVGVANVGIAAVHLLPAFPLDGGRVLRVALFRLTGDVLRATRAASWAGAVVGWSIVFVGVALAYSRGALLGVAVALAGWLVASGAADGYAIVAAQGEEDR